MKRLARIARFIRLRIAASEAKVKHIAEKHGVPLETVKEMGEVDPSGGKYLEWMVKQTKQGAVVWPYDAKRMVYALEAFKEITLKKNLMEQYGVSKDLNRYTLLNLSDLAKKYRGGAGPKPDSYRQSLPEGVEKIYDDGTYAILKVMTVEAACQYASGTQWCTSDPRTAEGYLDEGPLYVVFVDGKKFSQFHGSQKPTNLQDEPIENDQLNVIIDKLGISMVSEEEMDEANERQDHAWERYWSENIQEMAFNDIPYQREQYTENFEADRKEEEFESVLESLLRQRLPGFSDARLSPEAEYEHEKRARDEAWASVGETWDEGWKAHLDSMESDFMQWAYDGLESMRDEERTHWEEANPIEDFLE